MSLFFSTYWWCFSVFDIFWYPWSGIKEYRRQLWTIVSTIKPLSFFGSYFLPMAPDHYIFLFFLLEFCLLDHIRDVRILTFLSLLLLYFKKLLFFFYSRLGLTLQWPVRSWLYWLWQTVWRIWKSDWRAWWWGPAALGSLSLQRTWCVLLCGLFFQSVGILKQMSSSTFGRDFFF